MTHRNLSTMTIVGLLCVGLIAVAASAAVAQAPSPTGKPTTTPPTESHPSGAPTNQTYPSGAPANATGKPSDVPMASRQPGRLTFGNGTLDGRYVDATYDEAAGTITAYQVNGVEYFATIQAPSNFTASGHGAQVSFKGDNFTIAVTDSPAGLLRVNAPNLSVALTLSSGVEATANGSRVELSSGNDTAIITNATLDGGQAAIEVGIFMLHGKSVAGAAKAGAPSEAKIGEAVADGRVAARVEVMEQGADVLDFQGASVEARENANGSHRFIVDANFTSGRAFVVDFAPGLLVADELGVLYYDEVNGALQPAPIQRADSLDDVLLIEAGEGPEYWHVDEHAGEQIIVAVPSFSVHAFDVYAESSESDGSNTPMFGATVVAAVLLVSALALAAVRGRRNE